MVPSNFKVTTLSINLVACTMFPGISKECMRDNLVNSQGSISCYMNGYCIGLLTLRFFIGMIMVLKSPTKTRNEWVFNECSFLQKGIEID